MPNKTIEINGGMNIRIFKGLSFNYSASYARVRDQITLLDLSPREVVLAILAATGTTVIVLVPFVYLQGELRVYYVPLALVVGIQILNDAGMLVLLKLGRRDTAGPTKEMPQMDGSDLQRRIGDPRGRQPRQAMETIWFVFPEPRMGRSAIKAILQEVGTEIPVQLGGGIRSGS